MRAQRGASRRRRCCGTAGAVLAWRSSVSVMSAPSPRSRNLVRMVPDFGAPEPGLIRFSGPVVEERVTFCRICEALCGMVATVEDGKVTQLRPDRDHPLSRGYACPKGIAMLDVQNDPDRVVHPLRRRSDGEFERVSWDDALADITSRL